MLSFLRLPAANTEDAYRRRRLLLVFGIVTGLILISFVWFMLARPDSTKAPQAPKISNVPASKTQATASVGDTGPGQLNLSYPANWVTSSEANQAEDGYDDLTITSPNNLSVYIATNYPCGDTEADSEYNVANIGNSFTMNGAAYQLVSVSAPDESDTSATDEFVGLYITTAGNTSQDIPTGPNVCTVLSIPNPAGADDTPTYANAQQLMSAPDYAQALDILKSALKG